MTDASPLIVPMVVEAFVANDWVRQGGPFVRAQMQYNAMQRGTNGQPGLNDRDINFGKTNPVPPHTVPASDYYNGVYLKWRLPKAFTRGAQDSAGSTMHFRCIPNRWVVVRYGGPLSARTASAWIVESDYIWPLNTPQPAMTAAEVSSTWVQGATGTKPIGVYMGRNVALGSWTEPNTTQKLTAMAPGNPAFAFYQPQNNNVLSFIDVLGNAPAETLSYQVFGWFSAPGDDPLADPHKEGFQKVMADLGWTLPEGTDPSLTASWSVLTGYVSGVQWQTTDLPPSAKPTSTSPVSIAAGNTAVEGLTALVTAQAAEKGVQVDAELLEAFQLDMLAELDQPDGAGRLAEKLHASFFKRFSGGYTWDIVDAPGAEAVSETELAKEIAWLTALNQAQAKLDADIRLLTSLQVELYEMWWKYTVWPQAYKGQTVVKGPTGQPLKQSDLLAQLQPSGAGTIAQQVASQLHTVQTDQDAVPTGATQDDLNAAIKKYGDDHALPSTRILKRSAAPRFYEPNNPVVLIAGAGATGIVPDPDATVCRFPSQLVTGFKYKGNDVTASTQGLTVPRPDLSKVSGAPWSAALAGQLVDEAFFVDPQSATAISAAVPNSTVAEIQAAMASDPLGTPPAGALTAWTENPWHPLLLIWQVTYYPIDYGTAASPNWVFENGRYAWTGAGAEQSTGFGGVIQLTPAASFNMAARLQAFLATNPQLDPRELAELQQLLDFVTTTDNDWDVLSQALDGFNEQLRLGMAGVFMGPETTAVATSPSMPTLIGDQDSYPPVLGDVPRRVIPPSNFLPWRAGQFSFVELVVVDEWGQAVWPIDDSSSRYETVYLPPDMTPIVTSNSVEFTIAAKLHVDGVAPDVIAAGGGDATLVVTGSGFGADANVEWNGTALATTFQSAAQVTATVPAAQTASAATAQVTVTSGGNASNAVPVVVVVASGAAIAALDPDLFQAGMANSAEVGLTVTGVGFATNSIVQWDGTPLRTAYRSATELRAAIPAGFLAAPATAAVTVATGGTTSQPATFTIAPGAAIGSIAPASAVAGGPAFTLTVNGIGFEPGAAVAWNGMALTTTFVSPTQLTASVPAADIQAADTAHVTEQFGHSVLPAATETLAQVPPALLEPARLDFDLLSATDDSVVFGPTAPDADPVCGWVLPNHLDGSLMAYDAAGTALGEMAVGVGLSGTAHPCWTNAPGSPYKSLGEIAQEIKHFGPFLQTLCGQTATTFSAFLTAIDETLWTTVPMDAVFDKSLAVLIGRPLAMVRAQVQFELDGPAYPDPSWQFTFTPQPNVLAGYEFPIELGNVAQLNDGLIGYFEEDDYGRFNVVQQSGAAESDYLHPIGENGNYVKLPFDGKSLTHLSMLVDPRGPVHATTAILPDVTVALPQRFVDDALAAMDVTFRLDGILTDQQIAAPAQAGGSETTTVQLPLPDEKVGTWSWVENDVGGWMTYPTAPNDATARLSEVPPVLRRGLLQLSAALGKQRRG
ncbi:MAG: IPT/TIG domain-containing protein [Actinomycetota bacterium]|nr:IPT/TIG domain-containing protein [Actinomycetota bacterium]